jgi:hypothetical protein
MSITATVVNDMIKLPEGTHLEDGTQVVIVPQKRSPFLERFQDIIGTEGSGIGDLADNHDHYLYGAARKPRP